MGKAARMDTWTSGLDHLSPFQLKDELIRYARDQARNSGRDAQVSERRPRQSELDRDDAARGVLPARSVRAGRVQTRVGRAGLRRDAAQSDGIADRLRAFLRETPASAGARLLGAAVDYGIIGARLRR